MPPEQIVQIEVHGALDSIMRLTALVSEWLDISRQQLEAVKGEQGTELTVLLERRRRIMPLIAELTDAHRQAPGADAPFADADAPTRSRLMECLGTIAQMQAQSTKLDAECARLLSARMRERAAEIAKMRTGSQLRSVYSSSAHRRMPSRFLDSNT